MPTTSIIVRMDLELNTRRWAKALVRSGQDDLKAVEAIAIKASTEDQVAFFARDSRSGAYENGEYRGYLFVLYCADGSLVDNMLRIGQSTNINNSFATSSSAMFFSKHGKVILAWQMMF